MNNSSSYVLFDVYYNFLGIRMIQKYWLWLTLLQHIKGMKYWSLRRFSRWNSAMITLSTSLSAILNMLLLSDYIYLVSDILQSNRRTIMDDPFIRNYIEDLLKNVRTQVLLKLIKPYTRIRIPFISKVITRVFSFPASSKIFFHMLAHWW